VGKPSSSLVRDPSFDGSVLARSDPPKMDHFNEAKITRKLAKSLRWHAQSPATVLLDSRLDPLAKVVYGILALESWGPNSYIGQRLLAKLLGVSQQTIMRRLDLLKTTGHIDIQEEGHGKRSRYVLKSPVFTERPKKDSKGKWAPARKTQANMAALAHAVTRSAG
jgi:hypothetical protein